MMKLSYLLNRQVFKESLKNRMIFYSILGFIIGEVIAIGFNGSFKIVYHVIFPMLFAITYSFPLVIAYIPMKKWINRVLSSLVWGFGLSLVISL